MSQFDFKQFRVRQDRCAMKVGTDGVLLGAWAEGGQRILDIGTGTGVIALMMAQRFPKAQIVGIDVDAEACQQARQNAAESPFADRVEVQQTAVQNYLASSASHHEPDATTGTHFFDSIVSNPPFFVDSLTNPDPRKALARHTDTLSFADLFSAVSRLLSGNGVFSAVIPFDASEDFCSYAYFSGLYLSRQYLVKTKDNKPVKRCLLAFRKQRPQALECLEVCLQEENGERSGWYQQLTSDFYL